MRFFFSILSVMLFSSFLASMTACLLKPFASILHLFQLVIKFITSKNCLPFQDLSRLGIIRCWGAAMLRGVKKKRTQCNSTVIGVFKFNVDGAPKEQE